MDHKLNYIYDLFKNAECELVYHNLFELIISVVLSAQTTDKKVNKVTPNLFNKYKNSNDLANAKLDDVSEILKSLGMNNVKAKFIINLAKELEEKYDGIVPQSKDDLISLAGVGNKTANVVMAEGFKIPAFPVDTHIIRIANRLGYVKTQDPNKIEMVLKEIIEKNMWIKMHHCLIHFGRYFCKAAKPKCLECKLKKDCCYFIAQK